MSDKNKEYQIRKKLAELNVLVVDDSRFDRDLVIATLKKIGIDQIQVAENGKIAASKVSNLQAMKQGFDIIFLDSKMPAQDGLGFLKWMRGDFKLRNQIVIVTTGTSDFSDASGFIDLGVKAFVVKPVTLKVLEGKIFEILGLGQKHAS